jgi:hypothetical protein
VNKNRLVSETVQLNSCEVGDDDDGIGGGGGGDVDDDDNDRDECVGVETCAIGRYAL